MESDQHQKRLEEAVFEPETERSKADRDNLKVTSDHLSVEITSWHSLLMFSTQWTSSVIFELG